MAMGLFRLEVYTKRCDLKKGNIRAASGGNAVNILEGYPQQYGFRSRHRKGYTGEFPQYLSESGNMRRTLPDARRWTVAWQGFLSDAEATSPD
jgi:hypothetical protein